MIEGKLGQLADLQEQQGEATDHTPGCKVPDGTLQVVLGQRAETLLAQVVEAEIEADLGEGVPDRMDAKELTKSEIFDLVAASQEEQARCDQQVEELLAFASLLPDDGEESKGRITVEGFDKAEALEDGTIKVVGATLRYTEG